MEKPASSETAGGRIVGLQSVILDDKDSEDNVYEVIELETVKSKVPGPDNANKDNSIEIKTVKKTYSKTMRSSQIVTLVEIENADRAVPEATTAFLQEPTDADSDQEIFIKKPKTKKIIKSDEIIVQPQWQELGRFESIDSAKEFISNLGGWGIKHSTRCAIVYRCNAVKKRAKIQCNCQLRIRIITHSICVVLQNYHPHNHDKISEVNRANKTLGDAERSLINNEVQYRTKRLMIRRKLYENNLAQGISRHVINNCITESIQNHFGSSKITYGDLENIFQGSEPHDDLEENIDKAYVFKYSIDSRKNNFRGLITTFRLIKLLKFVEGLSIDGTYKTNSDGFPLITIGTIDRNRKFHILAFVITTDETCNAYEFAFSTLKELDKKFNDHDFSPPAIISDAALQIKKAYSNIFPETSRKLMCWVHVQRNVQKKVNVLVKKENQKLIMDDIYLLKKCYNDQLFEKTVKIFMQKWSTIEKEFVDYFRVQWLDIGAWHVGSVSFSASDNNALEGFHRVLKECYLSRDRRPLSHLIAELLTVASTESQKYDKENKKFSTATSWAKEDWQEGINLSKQRFSYVRQGNDIFIPRDLKKIISSKDIDDYVNIPWRTMSGIEKQAFNIFKVTLDATEIKNSICACPKFFRAFKCSHILAMAITLDKIQIPLEFQPDKSVIRRANNGPREMSRR